LQWDANDAQARNGREHVVGREAGVRGKDLLPTGTKRERQAAGRAERKKERNKHGENNKTQPRIFFFSNAHARNGRDVVVPGIYSYAG
jgi:hypothetical protein